MSNGVVFESSVNSDGTQTKYLMIAIKDAFESSVNSDGTQTFSRPEMFTKSLRVV